MRKLRTSLALFALGAALLIGAAAQLASGPAASSGTVVAMNKADLVGA
ncbi:hypothetical protein ACE1OC_36805 [Streptomyces sp. DSM 116496]